MVLVVFGFVSFGTVSYLLDHGYLVDAAFVYPRPDSSQFDNEVLQWGAFAYLRTGFLLAGYSGVVLLGIAGIIYLKKNRK